MLTLSSIEDVTVSRSVPAQGRNDQMADEHLRPKIKPSNNVFIGVDSNGGVEENYLDFYGLELMAGTNFSGSPALDWNKIIVSERILKRLEIDDPQEAIGLQFDYFFDTSLDAPYNAENPAAVTVIGVVKDYEINTMRHGSDPQGFLFTFGSQLSNINPRVCSVKIYPQHLDGVVEEIEKIYTEIFPDDPINQVFLDDMVKSHYYQEFEVRDIMAGYTLLAILISSLGLFGLLSIIIVQRTKEIGIRKVLGASIQSLVTTIGSVYVRLISFAGLFSLPVVYYFADDFLNNYRVRTEIEMWLLIGPFLVLVGITVMIVISRVIYVASLNPSESLRYE